MTLSITFLVWVWISLHNVRPCRLIDDSEIANEVAAALHTQLRDCITCWGNVTHLYLWHEIGSVAVKVGVPLLICRQS